MGHRIPLQPVALHERHDDGVGDGRRLRDLHVVVGQVPALVAGAHDDLLRVEAGERPRREARAGREVTVLEASDAVGGMAATREFAPGYRVSCAHLVYLLDAGIVQELALPAHGLRFAAEGLSTIALDPVGEHLSIEGDRLDGPGVSAADHDAWPAYRRRMAKFAAFIGSLHDQAPPRLRRAPGELYALARLALRLRRMGRDDMREFLRIAGINVHDVLEEQFESPSLKGALALDALLGSFSGPRSNNTVFTALHRLSAGGTYSIPAGGMGAVTDALARAAEAAGAELRRNARVRRIRSDGLAVSGVELENVAPAGPGPGPGRGGDRGQRGVDARGAGRDHLHLRAVWLRQLLVDRHPDRRHQRDSTEPANHPLPIGSLVPCRRHGGLFSDGMHRGDDCLRDEGGERKAEG